MKDCHFRWLSLTLVVNDSAMRSAELRGTHYQTTQTYERGRTLEFSNKPALRIAGVSTSCL